MLQITGEWVGVEWDDSSRGKHNGEHDGVQYFTCRSVTNDYNIDVIIFVLIVFQIVGLLLELKNWSLERHL